jgi:hypothetical protein
MAVLLGALQSTLHQPPEGCNDVNESLADSIFKGSEFITTPARTEEALSSILDSHLPMSSSRVLSASETTVKPAVEADALPIEKAKIKVVGRFNRNFDPVSWCIRKVEVTWIVRRSLCPLSGTSRE